MDAQNVCVCEYKGEAMTVTFKFSLPLLYMGIHFTCLIALLYIAESAIHLEAHFHSNCN